MENLGNHYLGAEILMDFTKSIEHIERYETAVHGLNSNLGSLEGRLEALRGSLATMNEAKPGNLRANIEAQLRNAIMKNGVVIENVGDSPFVIKKSTITQLNKQIEAHLNATLAEQAENIKLKIDPNYKRATTTTISGEHFDKFNDEVAKMVKNQMRNIGNQLKDMGVGGITEDDIKGQTLVIGKSLVQTIIRQVKTAVKPILENPVVDVEGVVLKVPKKDAQLLASRVAQQITASLANTPIQDLKVPVKSFDDINNTIAKMVMNQINNLNDNLRTLDTATLHRPVEELNNATRGIIARQIGTSAEELEKSGLRITNAQINTVHIQEMFDKLGRTFNNKLNQMTNAYAKDVVEEIKKVNFEVMPSLTHELNSDLKKINDALIRKIRSQIDSQMAHIMAEIEAAGVAPTALHRSNALRMFGAGNGGGGSAAASRSTVNNTVINNYSNNRPQTSLSGANRPNQYGDPYARRDAYFNNFGFENALKNTFRHIMAGAMIGAPIMAVYEAMNTFKETQLEFLKMYQNYYMKEVSEEGSADPEQIKAEIDAIMPRIKDMSVFYGIDYTPMSQVAAIASRLTETEDEAIQFSNAAAMIYRLDNSGDIVEDIAPGLEAIMAQFGKTVWELDEVISSFAVATNVTKASTEELMAGLARSGSSFNAANIGVPEATMMIAGALQTTGLSGSDIGNMFKTMNQRMSMPTVQKALAEAGISVYEKDENGKTVRRDGIDLYTEIANLVTNPNMGDELIDQLLGTAAGMYQVGKLRAFIGSMNTNGTTVKDEEGNEYTPFNIHKYIEQAQNETMDSVYDLLQGSLDNPAISMERAGVAVNVALTSLLEEMSPTIETLANGIVKLSGFVQDNSEAISNLINALVYAAIGFGVKYGAGWAVNKGGFQQHRENYQLQDKLYGSRSGSVQTNLAPVAAKMESELTPLVERSRRSFELLAMASASPAIIGTIQSMANMNPERIRQMMDYNDDVRGGRNISSFAELATLIAESENYDNGNMSEDEKRARAKQNLGALTQRNELTHVFSEGMRDALDNYDPNTADERTNRTMGTIARMDDNRMTGFARHLEEDGQRNGTRISNLNDLNDSYERYSTMQRSQVDLAMSQDRELRNLNNRYRDMMNQLSGTNNVGGGFNRFLDNARNRTAALGRSFVSLGKSIGSMGLQMAAFMAIGDIFTNNAEYGTMTKTQKELSNKETDRDSIKNYLESRAEMWNPDNSWLDKLGSMFTGGVGTTYNTLMDMFIKGNDRMGWNDLWKGKAEADEYLKEKYGTKDVDAILKENNITMGELLAEISEKTGLGEDISKLEEKDFKEQYKEFMNSQGLQDKMRLEAEASRETYNRKLLEENPSQIFIGELLEMMNKDIESITGENALSEITGLLNGMKSTSQEYYDLMIANLKREIDLYDEYISTYDEQIAEKEKALKDMETKDGDDAKITDEYKDIEQELKDLREARDKIIEETEANKAEAELERLRLIYQKNIQRINRQISDYDYGNYMEEFQRDMTTEQGSEEEAQWTRDLINKKKQQAQDIIDSYKAIQGVDIDDQTRELIREQEKAIADLNKQYAQTYLDSLGSYQENINRYSKENEVKLLRAQVSSGIVNSDDPALKGVRMGLLAGERNKIEQELAALQQAMTEIGDTDPDVLKQYQEQLVNLQQQSLQVQLEQLREMKSGGGTFNLPDGIQVMSQLDYVMGQGTHTQFSLQQGETYVTVVLPNVNGNTSANQLDAIGRSLGSGISNGRMSSYRAMISSNPSSYRVLT